MESSESLADWLVRLKTGDPSAAERIWQRFYIRLVELARRRLSVARTVRDEEDLALSAFASFCAGAKEGRFPLLEDRDDLWRVLIVLVCRKISHHVESEGRLKRGGGREQVPLEMGQVIGGEPSPDVAAEMADQCEHLLGLLPEEGLRRVAVWKMEGYTTEEVAARLGVVPRTVERKVQMIRELWSQSGEGTQ